MRQLLDQGCERIRWQHGARAPKYSSSVITNPHLMVATRDSEIVHFIADARPRVSLLARARLWVAVIVAAIIFALIPLIDLQLIFAVPLIGLALAAGVPPDYVPDAKPVDR